jgi:hypothetical protein
LVLLERATSLLLEKKKKKKKKKKVEPCKTLIVQGEMKP